nr:unnamed protein product [Naegleria fowleri]
MIKGDGSLINKLQISKSDDSEKTWEAIEKRKIIEEFASAAMEDDEDDNLGDSNPTSSASALKRHVNKLFEDYYDSFFEDVNAATGDTFKFKYKTVDKADFGLTTEDIINLDDDDLDKIVSMKHLMRYDYKPPDEKVKKDIFFKIRNLKAQKGLLDKKTERALKFKQGKMGKNKTTKQNEAHKNEGDKKNSNNNKKNFKSNNSQPNKKNQGTLKRKFDQEPQTVKSSSQKPQNSNATKKNQQKQATKDVASSSQQEPPKKKNKLRGKNTKE